VTPVVPNALGVYPEAMNLFKPFTLRWWQMGLFKLCLACGGIILGVYFHAFFLTSMPVVAVLFVLSAMYLIAVWWKQMQQLP